MNIHFTVPTIPVAQPRQRHRVISKGGKAFATNYTPKADPVNAFKAAVQLAATAAYNGAPLECPLRMELQFVFPRRSATPKRIKDRQWHTAKPDADNLAKAVMDCMNGLIYKDDSQVAMLVIYKQRAAVDEQPHVVVTILELK